MSGYAQSSKFNKEKGAVGFENYLASVFGINHLRRLYPGVNRPLWSSKLTSNDFNPFGESTRFVHTNEIINGYSTNHKWEWQIAPVSTPQEVLKTITFGSQAN